MGEQSLCNRLSVRQDGQMERSFAVIVSHRDGSALGEVAHLDFFRIQELDSIVERCLAAVVFGVEMPPGAYELGEGPLAVSQTGPAFSKIGKRGSAKAVNLVGLRVFA